MVPKPQQPGALLSRSSDEKIMVQAAVWVESQCCFEETEITYFPVFSPIV